LLSSEKNNFIGFKCDYFNRLITRIVTLLLCLSIKKYDIALFAEPLNIKLKIIWRLIRVKHKEILWILLLILIKRTAYKIIIPLYIQRN